MAQQIPFTVRLKTALKMCIQRLRYSQEKQQALAKQSRREVARLLSQGAEQKATYRVESLIYDDIHIELLELIELYCELLHARVSILAEIPDEITLTEEHSEDGISEAVRTLIYTQNHVPEIKDLLRVKELFTFKFGIDFLNKVVQEKDGVPSKITSKCSPSMPPKSLVNLYLQEIAATYEIPFSGSAQATTEDNSSQDGDNVATDKPVDDHYSDEKPIIAGDTYASADEKHPITVKMPRKNSESLEKDFKIPKSLAKDVKLTRKKEKISTDDELEDLKQRFAALRR